MATVSINADYHDISNGAAGLHSHCCWIYMSNCSYYAGKNDIQFVLKKIQHPGRGERGNIV